MANQNFHDDWTLVNPLGHLSVAAETPNRITYTGLTRAETTYAWRDFGVGSFAPPFSHDFEFCQTAVSAEGSPTVYALTNSRDDVYSWYAGRPTQVIMVRLYAAASTIYLSEFETPEHDIYASFSLNTTYYARLLRPDETTIQLELYSNAARTVLLDTLAISIPTGRRWQWGQVATSWDSGHAALTASGWVANLDLGEAGAAAVPPAFMFDAIGGI